MDGTVLCAKVLILLCLHWKPIEHETWKKKTNAKTFLDDIPTKVFVYLFNKMLKALSKTTYEVFDKVSISLESSSCSES